MIGKKKYLDKKRIPEMYTSGTTGKPKGICTINKHIQIGYYLLASITAVELSISKEDNALIVMPLCHANSFNFFC